MVMLIFAVWGDWQLAGRLVRPERTLPGGRNDMGPGLGTTHALTSVSFNMSGGSGTPYHVHLAHKFSSTFELAYLEASRSSRRRISRSCPSKSPPRRRRVSWSRADATTQAGNTHHSDWLGRGRCRVQRTARPSQLRHRGSYPQRLCPRWELRLMSSGPRCLLPDGLRRPERGPFSWLHQWKGFVLEAERRVKVRWELTLLGVWARTRLIRLGAIGNSHTEAVRSDRKGRFLTFLVSFCKSLPSTCTAYIFFLSLCTYVAQVYVHVLPLEAQPLKNDSVADCSLCLLSSCPAISPFPPYISYFPALVTGSAR